MDIHILTPAPPGSRAGNRATAERWQRLLKGAGHRVTVLTSLSDAPCDLFIALHAWRSHEDIERFRELNPQVPLITVLTGTDIYFHQHEYPEPTHRSMRLSDALIGLHHRVSLDIPEIFRSKLSIVLQSADKTTSSRAVAGTAPRNHFDVCVIGHLRDEKDSLRAALACQYLPTDSRIRVIAAGKAHNEEWQRRAEQAEADNPRFQWLGEVDQPAVQELMARSQLMVVSSVMEGGANVISEACRAGLPILASDISGNRGLLGDDYPGYFPVKSERGLAELLTRAETSTDYLDDLRSRVSEKAELFVPEAEQSALLSAMERAISNSKVRLSP